MPSSSSVTVDAAVQPEVGRMRHPSTRHLHPRPRNWGPRGHTASPSSCRGTSQRIGRRLPAAGVGSDGSREPRTSRAPSTVGRRDARAPGARGEGAFWHQAREMRRRRRRTSPRSLLRSPRGRSSGRARLRSIVSADWGRSLIRGAQPTRCGQRTGRARPGGAGIRSHAVDLRQARPRGTRQAGVPRRLPRAPRSRSRRCVPSRARARSNVVARYRIDPPRVAACCRRSGGLPGGRSPAGC